MSSAFSSTKHIIVHQDDLRFECLHCLTSKRLELPSPASLWIKFALDFSTEHHKCLPKHKESK